MPRFPTILFASAALVGCTTVGPDYARPEVAAAQGGWLEPAADTGPVETAWWERFDDPVLTGLVRRALADSPDIREAEARLAESRANRDAVYGGRVPRVEANGSAAENVLSENGQLPVAQIPGFSRDYRLFDLGFDASWEIDFWGRQTRRSEAVDARAEAALAARRDVQVTLTGEVARAYFDLRAAQAEVSVATETATANAELSRLTGLRAAAGEATTIDAGRARSAADGSRAAVAEARAQASAAAYRIATLVGVAPEAIVPSLLDDAAIPDAPDAILTGLRSDLLERRPDIRRAERELAAATADVGVATADLFPRFSLIGSIGQQARSPDSLIDTDSTRLRIGPSFSWPIFSGGTIRAQIRAADAREQAAAARYDKAVIAALNDSESAINRFANARVAAESTRSALSGEVAAYGLAGRRVTAGEDDRLALQRARLRVIDARDRDARARAGVGRAAVALYKALGGGWSQ